MLLKTHMRFCAHLWHSSKNKDVRERLLVLRRLYLEIYRSYRVSCYPFTQSCLKFCPKHIVT